MAPDPADSQSRFAALSAHVRASRRRRSLWALAASVFSLAALAAIAMYVIPAFVLGLVQ